MTADFQSSLGGNTKTNLSPSPWLHEALPAQSSCAMVKAID